MRPNHNTQQPSFFTFSFSSFFSFFSLFLFFYTPWVNAENNTTPLSISPAQLEQYTRAVNDQRLYDSPYWLKLMYYKKNKKTKKQGYQSEVNNTSFFLSPKGNTDRTAEIHALLYQLFQQTENPDQHVRCVFPARAAWLKEKLNITDALLPAHHCPRLDAWLESIAPRYTTLVFSSGFVNNPSSMYGHTLLRIDPNTNQNQRLISYAINYAAISDKETGLRYAYKGLTGGFDGGYSLIPYYEKVREYGAAEHRDLWEYELNLSNNETQRLMQHFWEMRNIHFPYYYAKVNCSYELLALLDIAREGLNLRSQFNWVTIPTDTLRVALQDNGLLKTITFRPAQTTKLAAQIDHASPAIIASTKALIKNPHAEFAQTFPPLSDTKEQAAALSLAADVLYQQLKKNAPDSQVKRNHVLTLMQRRSLIDQPATDIQVEQPAIDPSQGHKTSRWSFGVNHTAQETVADIELRPSYHDLLDPSAGYQDGAAISLLRTRVQLSAQDVHLKTFEAVAIQALDPQNSILKPTSWGMGAGLRQAESTPQISPTQPIAAYAHGNWGVTVPIQSLKCYALANGEAEVANKLSHGWAAAVGATAGCLYNSNAINTIAEAKQLFWLPTEHWQTLINVGVQIPIHHDHALRLTTEQTLLTHLPDDGSSHAQTWHLAWIKYF